MRRISARWVGITFLCAVSLTGLSVQGARRAAAGDAIAQASPAVPPACGAGILTPVKVKVIGTLVAQAFTECADGTLFYLRLKVVLQRKVDGVWKWRASSTGVATEPLTRFAVKVSAPCRIGPHRTFSVHSFRRNLTDPWQVGPRWHSPSMLVRRCPE
jgi:hypothetical protein